MNMKKQLVLIALFAFLLLTAVNAEAQKKILRAKTVDPEWAKANSFAETDTHTNNSAPTNQRPGFPGRPNASAGSVHIGQTAVVKSGALSTADINELQNFIAEYYQVRGEALQRGFDFQHETTGKTQIESPQQRQGRKIETGAQIGGAVMEIIGKYRGRYVAYRIEELGRQMQQNAPAMFLETYQVAVTIGEQPWGTPEFTLQNYGSPENGPEYLLAGGDLSLIGVDKYGRYHPNLFIKDSTGNYVQVKQNLTPLPQLFDISRTRAKVLTMLAFLNSQYSNQ